MVQTVPAQASSTVAVSAKPSGVWPTSRSCPPAPVFSAELPFRIWYSGPAYVLRLRIHHILGCRAADPLQKLPWRRKAKPSDRLGPLAF